jgi:chromosome partitioning protein
MPTIAIVNQKGGSGKTTTAVNVACELARRGERTLLVDMDPQSHCALGLSAPETRIERGTAEVMLGLATIADVAWEVGRGLDLAPSTTGLAGVEAARGGLADADDRGERLAKALDATGDRYAWRLIDCPPSIGLLTYNALRAADEVLIPVEAGYFALRGAVRQVAALEALDRRTGRRTRRRIVLTMHDPLRAVCRDVRDRLTERFGSDVAPIAIRYDLSVKEAAALGIGVVEHAPGSCAADDYEALTEWLVDRVAPRSDEPASEPARVEVEAKTSTVSRAAELAARTRALLARSAELAARGAPASGVAATGPSNGRAPAREPGGVALAVDRSADPTPARGPAPTDARSFGVRETSRGLLFVFPAGPHAEIYVASDVNGWSTRAHRMRFNDSIGAHELCVRFPAGRHRYRYVVDGEWIPDPHNPRTEPNPFGGLDSVVEVGARR